MPIVILPRLDGTDLRLGRFVALAPAQCLVTVLPLPDNSADDDDSLTRSVGDRIRGLGPCHLVHLFGSVSELISLSPSLPQVVTVKLGEENSTTSARNRIDEMPDLR